MRLITICKSKIHRATITETDVNYVGSITIDMDLMERAGIVDGEMVQVWDVDNGERFSTYAIPGERGSGAICVNGAAAHKVGLGHKIIVAAFCLTDEPVTRKVVLVDDNNRFMRNL
ncbi:MAG: aspartate 1-decarboxylase [Armatimonadota bacterium]|nr:aspartate 1-decarboxylase [Armatimonadota bacterium]